jgi:hypothetical protein
MMKDFCTVIRYHNAHMLPSEDILKGNTVTQNLQLIFCVARRLGKVM